MPIATTAEQRAIADSVRAWAQRAHPIDTVRADESDPEAWRGTWSGLTELGVCEVIAAGGSLTDLSRFVEQCATVLAPGPVLGTAVAAAVLGSAPDEPVALAFAPDGPVLAAGPDAALLAPDADGTLAPLRVRHRQVHRHRRRRPVPPGSRTARQRHR